MRTKFKALSAVTVMLFGLLAMGSIYAQDAGSPASASYGRAEPDTTGVEYVVVQSVGRGPSAQSAVNNAIRLAFEQVNGKSFDASTTTIDAGISADSDYSRSETAHSEAHAKADIDLDVESSASDDVKIQGTAEANESFDAKSDYSRKDSLDIKGTAFADVVTSESKGKVKEFKVLSQKTVDGQVEVLIEARIEKYVQSAGASYLRLAISPIRTGQSSYNIGGASVSAEKIAAQISDGLLQAFTKSKRLTVLDREFSAEIAQELNRIDATNTDNDDYLRLGKQLAADYLLLGRVDSFEYRKQVRQLRTSDKVLVSYSGGGELTIRVVNVVTGQVEISESVAISLPSTEPSTNAGAVNASRVAGGLADKLAAAAARKAIVALFPVTVVSVDGDTVALSQGGELLKAGQSYQVVLRGAEIKDPQTGRVIGRVEKECCTIKIDRVTSEMSYGTILNSKVGDVSAVFQPGALELRAQLANVSTKSTSATSTKRSAPPPAPAPRKPVAPVIPDGDSDEDW
jgi:curli biogenesis system outer membrane secretion channel CsgG